MGQVSNNWKWNPQHLGHRARCPRYLIPHYLFLLLGESVHIYGGGGDEQEKHQLEKHPNFRILLEIFILTLLVVFNNAKLAHYPCIPVWCAGNTWDRKPNALRLAHVPSLPWTACLQLQATSPERDQASTATKRSSQGYFIYGFNNRVSWEIFGFPFPEAKMHL